MTLMPRRGTRVLVAGLGRSGEAAARQLLKMGLAVIVADDASDAAVRERADALAGAEVSLGGLDPSLVDGVQLVVASPGIRPSAPVLAAAVSAGIPVWSEVELASRLARVPVIGVTGTNGKTTTTQMLAGALNAAGIRAVAAGNIGYPLCDAAVGDADVIVAEISSFQLHFIESFHARVGVLLNLAPDHIDWHGSLDDYGADKSRLFENQIAGDTAVVLADPACERLVRGAGTLVRFDSGRPPQDGAGVEDGWIITPQGRVVEASRLAVRGRALLADAVAAAAAACAFGADPMHTGAGLAAFRPAPHRMEHVAEIDGVSYVNDSKATNPHAALAALDGLHDVVLIAGGRNKGLDLSVLSDATGVKAVIAIGEAAGEIKAAFASHGVPVARAATMDEAVDRARSQAKPGDIVLLSPACASFDMFADYKARGEAFRAGVKRLKTGGMP